MRRRTAASLALFVLSATLVLTSIAPSSAGTWQRPRLRLIAAETEVELVRYSPRQAFDMRVGMWLASLRAPFELQVERRVYGEPIRAFEVIRSDDGQVRRNPLPDGLVTSWDGLDDFFRLVVTDDAGAQVKARRFGLCPNAWEQQRVNDRGPVRATYPATCGGNPFTQGMVWGVDQGWAASIADRAPSLKLDDGSYTATVSILQPYRELFRIADADATAQVHLSVRTDDWCEWCADERAATDRAPDGRLTEAATLSSPDPSTLPDLRSLPAYGIVVQRQQRRDWLTFGADVWNAGPAPLVVEGFRREGEPLMDAFQYFFRDGEVVGRSRVGGFEYDERDGHDHWHFRQFAGYRLLDATRSNPVVSTKEAFCLVPTDAVDLLVSGASYRPDLDGLWTACGWVGSIWIRETLPAGWGDTYHQSLPGQSFDISDLPNGTYWIEIAANPKGKLYERRTDNGVSYRKVILGGSPGARTVDVPAYKGIDSEAGWR